MNELEECIEVAARHAVNPGLPGSGYYIMVSVYGIASSSTLNIKVTPEDKPQEGYELRISKKDWKNALKEACK